MEFTVGRNELAEAVTYAVHGIPNNPLTPVRAGMLVRLDDREVMFAGSDGDVTFSAWGKHTRRGEGKFIEDAVLPGKLFADVIRTLPDKDVHVTTEKQVATVNCGRVQFKLPLYKEEYPELPVSSEATGKVESDVFADAIRKVVPAASRSDSNPSLASVYLEPAGDTLWAVCTDRYRLAAAQIKWDAPGPSGPVLVPSWAAERFTRNTTGPVSIGWDQRVFTMMCGSLQLTSRVWTGEFPGNWRNMLPQAPCTVDVDTETLLAALKRAQLASEVNSPVELTFGNGRLHVEAGYDNHADDILDASYDGEEFHVLFGIGYLTDGLAGCGPVSSFGFTDPNRPVYITSGSYSYTILPRRRI